MEVAKKLNKNHDKNKSFPSLNLLMFVSEGKDESEAKKESKRRYHKISNELKKTNNYILDYRCAWIESILKNADCKDIITQSESTSLFDKSGKLIPPKIK